MWPSAWETKMACQRPGTSIRYRSDMSPCFGFHTPVLTFCPCAHASVFVSQFYSSTFPRVQRHDLSAVYVLRILLLYLNDSSFAQACPDLHSASLIQQREADAAKVLIADTFLGPSAPSLAADGDWGGSIKGSIPEYEYLFWSPWLFNKL